MSDTTINTNASFRSDATTISIVALAHGTSHFFQLLLPPLFPWLATEFSLSFAQLGALASMLYIVSALGQAASGFLVDRIGAQPVMMGGLTLFVIAALVGASASGYEMLMLSAVLAGLGNSPFHPVDYSILNQRVSSARLGHAYSAHGITGSLGYATAAIVSVSIASAFSWRAALQVAAGWAGLVLIVVVIFRGAITTPIHRANAASSDAAARSTFGFLRLPIVWMCFAFFFVLTFAGAAIQNFSTPALTQIAGLSVTTAATALTGYLVLAAVGQIAGGFLASTARFDPEQGITLALGLSMLLLLAAGSGIASGYGVAVLVMLAGFGTGVAVPSRDLLIKRATPAGATGRVYGMVYSGLDAGLSVAAPLFGWLMDHGLPRGIFLGAALAMLASMTLSWVVALHSVAAVQPQRDPA
jgi:MFS transporter, FSR family, fosmidomycin resistance protein